MAIESSRPRQPGEGPAFQDTAVGLDAAVAERVRRAAHRGGRPLPPELRAWLERGLTADLEHVRVHTGEQADLLTSGLGVDAFTAGADVFVRRDRFDPGSPEGKRLIAHEVVHVLQQASTPFPRSGPDLVQHSWSPHEKQAADCAAALLRGAAVPPVAGRRATGRRRGGPLLVQCHGSWEHRLLGDFPTSSLKTLAAGEQTLKEKIGYQMLGLQDRWCRDPKKVDEGDISGIYPEMRTLRLKGSGLLVTYGELNALPDYLANPISIDEQPEDVMLPVLQQIRQEFYNRLLGYLQNRDLGYPEITFSKAYRPPGWVRYKIVPSGVKDSFDTDAIDAMTQAVGPKRTNRYKALLARQACHFAPYSWYRWEQYYLIARSLALRAFGMPKGSGKERLTREAWMYHGYADHFLQDSFASGHLIDKTRIMQWYVAWLIKKWKGQTVTLKWRFLVEGLSLLPFGDQRLYTRSDPGIARDPQTAEEQATKYSRMLLNGIDPAKPAAAGLYAKHMQLINFTAAQMCVAFLHDYFNKTSLWVASENHPAPFQVWGDYTMLQKDGVTGVEIISETSMMSQQSIKDVLGSGSSSVSSSDILARFPTKVQVAGTSGSQRLISLKEWHDDTAPNLLRDTVRTKIFEDRSPLWISDTFGAWHMTTSPSVDYLL